METLNIVIIVISSLIAGILAKPAYRWFKRTFLKKEWRLIFCDLKTPEIFRGFLVIVCFPGELFFSTEMC